MLINSLMDYKVDVSALNPGYKFIAADGFTLGSFSTTGMLTETGGTGKVYSLLNFNAGTATGVRWVCDNALLYAVEYFSTQAPTVAQIDTQLSGTHGAGAWGAFPGSGPVVVAVTVVDGSAVPLQNAAVLLTEGINNYEVLTNASGVATFGLAAATYSRAITKDGYQFTPDSIVVTVNANFGAVMTQTVIPAPPADPNSGTIYCYILPTDGSTKAGYIITASLIGDDGQDSGPYRLGGDFIAALIPKNSAPSDADGLAALSLFANALITPASTRWRIGVEGTEFSKDVKVAAGSSVNIGSFIV